MAMKNFLRHLSSLIAPVTMCIVVPYLILRYEDKQLPGLFDSSLRVFAGLLVTLTGLILLVATIRLFIQISQGTIMPWDPSRKLIVAVLYQHVRNPMILSIVILQIGEAVWFASSGIAVLAAAFFVINTLYFIFSEEPGLEKRFGTEYVEYQRNVPRWIPRRKPWHPS
jgi:protein-S-isoprenylcysteine O-methyltransferase Ste14